MVSTIEASLQKNALKKMLPLQAGDVMKTNADITKAKNLIGYKPVSYTHLDVYKRQEVVLLFLRFCAK